MTTSWPWPIRPCLSAQEFELFGGTPDYSSTSQLNECTTGPADDLESLVYAFLWMLSHGHLPWDCHRDLKKPKTPYSEGAPSAVGRGPWHVRLCGVHHAWRLRETALCVDVSTHSGEWTSAGRRQRCTNATQYLVFVQECSGKWCTCGRRHWKKRSKRDAYPLGSVAGRYTLIASRRIAAQALTEAETGS